MFFLFSRDRCICFYVYKLKTTRAEFNIFKVIVTRDPFDLEVRHNVLLQKFYYITARNIP